MGRTGRALVVIASALLVGLTLTYVGVAEAAGFELRNAGFRTPECVLHDVDRDVYLVSNINGNSGSKDGNGFISRISPAGEVLELKWIDGAASGTTLHAPKGMAIVGDRLYVADIDTLRVFNAATGASVENIGIPAAVFLNDVSAAPDGTVYVSDTPVGMIYSVSPAGAVGSVMAFPGCNGIAATEDFLYVVGWDGGQVVKINLGAGTASTITTIREALLDGVVVLDDGSLLVSSGGASAIYRVQPSGAKTVLFSGLPVPADIGYDEERGLVLIPLFDANQVLARPMP